MHAGVLAVQGDWEAHTAALRDAGATAVPIRTAAELENVEGLVMPGGESTAMLRLLAPDGLDRAISQRLEEGLPVLATCAGLILLAAAVQPEQPSLGVLDVDVRRNAYGRQLQSTVAAVELADELGEPATMDAVFIRAPRITRCGPAVRVLGRCGGDPVLVCQGRMVAATFHPELSADRRVHQLFCRLAEDTDVC